MSVAYWISPGGEVITVQTRHIADVIANPGKFGLTEKFVMNIYNLYNEKIGTEGKARDHVMFFLFDKGWIRIRKYKNLWSVNMLNLTNRSKTYLSKWAQAVLKGIDGFQEQDQYCQVKIDQKGNAMKYFDISVIAKSDEFITEDYQNYKIDFKKI